MSGQFSLLKQRRFAPFFLTQFFGAFNDNVFKNALIISIAFQVTAQAGAESNSNTLINLAAGLFILPFFLFSATAGQIADLCEKSALIRKVKLLEICIMLGGATAFILGSVPALLALLFLMGTQSTLFGPVKYSILPQQLKESELIGGNGLVEMGTFVAILLGTLTGGLLIGLEGGAQWTAMVLVSIAVCGYLASRQIPEAPAADPNLKINWNPVTETVKTLRLLKGNATVLHSVIGISWFWFFGATYLTQLPNYTRLTLGGNEQVVTLLLALFSVGVGVGSLLCERLSSGRVEIGLVPFGSIGLTLFAIDLYFAAPMPFGQEELIGAGTFLAAEGSFRVIADVLLIGLFGGFYIVPLYALIQARSEPSKRSRIIAGTNILNALFMVVSAITAAVLLGQGLSIPELFLATAAMNAAVACYIYKLVPEFLVRFLAWLLVHTIYRIRRSGFENIPEEGPVLLACNHVSFVDALIVGTCVHRPVRFVMYYKIYNMPVLNWIFRTVRAIPIAGAKEDAALLAKAMDEVAAALENNEVVVIFPEGAITHDGEMMRFRNGIEQIVERTPVPVIPMALSGLWGSWFSRRDGAAMSKLPSRFWSRISVTVGDLVPANAVEADDLHARVLALRGDNR